MHSALYEATVRHHRLTPRAHSFAYRVFYLWLDLDELDLLHRSLHCFARNRFALFSFFDRDHFQPQGAPDGLSTKENVLHFIREQGGDTAAIRHVRLLTFPRVLGYVFNPVCFYYAYDAEENPLYAVAEVTNTFHEQKPYLLSELEPAGRSQASPRFRLITPKHFYVSPFMALDLAFDFKLGLPGPHLEIHIDDKTGAEPVLLTGLTGQRRELSDTALVTVFFKYPLVTLRVIFLIHWQALRLWFKRVPWHRKADQPELQRDVLRPHQSLRSTPL